MLDEFVEMHTENELAKLENRRRHQSPQNRNLMGKIVEQMSNLYAVGEKNRVTDINAKKAAKMIVDVAGKNRNLPPRKKSSTRLGNEASRSPMKRYD